MDNNQFNQFNQFNPQGSNGNKKIFSMIGLACSCFGFLLTLIFSIVTCSRGYAASCEKFMGKKIFSFKLQLSLAIIGVVIGVLIAIAGIVLSILSIEKGTKISKIVIVSVAAGAFAIIYALFSNVTICSYNCSVNGNKEMKEANKQFEEMMDYTSGLKDSFGDLEDYYD